MKTVFVGISGVAGSGKDLFFKLLKNELDKKGIAAHRYSLADSLKRECSPYLLQHHQIDIFNCSRKEKDSVRPFLVFHGTMKRNASKGRHWIEILNRKITEENLTGVVCVTDIRYDEFERDEVDWVKDELGGVLVHICHKGVKPANAEETRQDPRLLEKCDYPIEWTTVKGGQNEVESQLTEKYVNKFVDWLLNEDRRQHSS
jgi:hypothetical protein